MRRVAVWLTIAAVFATMAHPRTATAQRPICPQPLHDAPYYAACAPGGRLLAARALYDFAIDHLLKADTMPIARRLGDVFRSLVTGDTGDKNGALQAYLDRLEAVKLTKLDTSTGLLQLGMSDDERRFASTLDIGGGSYELSWRLPAEIAGGYWRTPGVLQIAFWEGQRAAFTLGSPQGIVIDAEVTCLVISTDGLRVVTAGSSAPDVIVRFAECDS